MSGIDTSVVMHAAVVVRDLDSAVDAWKSVLGVSPTSVVDIVSTSNDEYEGAPTSASLRQAIFDVGNGFKLELMEPIGGPSVWADHLDTRGEGWHHIAFRVHGMEEGIRAYEALGVPLKQRGEFTGGRYAYFDEAKLGAMVELLEFDPGSADFIPEADYVREE